MYCSVWLSQLQLYSPSLISSLFMTSQVHTFYFGDVHVSEVREPIMQEMLINVSLRQNADNYYITKLKVTAV